MLSQGRSSASSKKEGVMFQIGMESSSQSHSEESSQRERFNLLRTLAEVCYLQGEVRAPAEPLNWGWAVVRDCIGKPPLPPVDSGIMS